MRGSPRLIIGRQSTALRETIWQLVRNAKKDDVLAPVTVIGPTRYANLSLRHELGRSGFINVRFIVLPVLLEMLGAPSLARAGRKPLTAVLESVALQSALSQSTGPLAPVREHPSTLTSVRASFRELRRVDGTVLDALEAQGGVRSELVGLYRSFRKSTTDEWYDVDDLAASAAEAVLNGDTAGLDDLGLIVFYLPGDLSTPETGLIRGLARQNRCVVLAGTTGDCDADRTVRALADALRSAFGETVKSDSHSEKQQVLSGEATLHIAPNAHEELRWVIRQIVKDASERETPFHRMAVLYRTENPYSSLIRDELGLASIPVAGPGRDTLAATGVGRTLLGLLDLSGGEFKRSDVMAWLTGCPVSPPSGRTPGFNPSQWDSLTRKAGIVGGLEQWRIRLNAYSRQLADDADRREKAEEINSARASRMRAEAAAARNALIFLERLASDVRPPSDGGSWTAFSQWAGGLLDIYLSRDIPQHESVAYDQITRILVELQAADRINPTTSAGEFCRTVEESLRAPLGHLGVTGQGVFVSSLAAASGMSFDVIWMVGMIEGSTPPAVRPDPLLPEPNWLSAGGESRLTALVASERYDYLSAVASAPRRTLSYPVADGSSQREAYPSRWFLEQATTLEGSRVHTGDLTKLSDRPWLTIIQSGEQSLNADQEVVSADRHDFDLRRLLQWRDGGRSPRLHPLVQHGTLANAARLGQNRNARYLTEFDGNLSGIVATSRFSGNLSQSPVSATSLESWAACPFRYFLGHVLRLSALESPEEITTISALDRGLLMHDILERFIRESTTSGELPLPGEAWDFRSQERLWNIAGEEFSTAESKGITGKRLLWNLAQREILDDLETFLEEDTDLRSSHGTSHLFVEASFGFSEDTPPVVDPETRVTFRGYIDRVDLVSDGSSALVIDYKTGSASPYDALRKDIIDQGKRLQLGVYSLAAHQMFPNAKDVKAAYWFTTTRGGFRFAPPEHFDIDNDEARQRFHEGVSTIVEGIRSGAFPANPGPPDRGSYSNCRYCDFDSICLSRRADLWDRKKSDKLLSGYLSLAVEPAEE